jgi:uncharacterized protein (TIGR02145 family)
MKDSGIKDRLVGDYPDTDGVVVQMSDPYVKSQDISLAFLCDTYAHYRTFLSYCIAQKVVDMYVPLTNETLRLEYLACPSFSYYGSYILFTVNFREANPSDRIPFFATTLHPRWNASGDPTIYGTDRFGFGALPSGFINSTAVFAGLGTNRAVWTSTIVDATRSYIGYSRFNYSDIYYPPTLNTYGASIRAVRAATTSELLLPDGLIPATYTDYDGNIYPCAKIGTQVWTTTNLKVTKYADGTDIPTNLSDVAWAADTTGAMAVYGKNYGAYVPVDELTTEALMVTAYGRLYNWYAVDNAHGLIDTSTGFHVPTDAEFTQLTDYLIATYPEITADNVGDVLKSNRQVAP